MKADSIPRSRFSLRDLVSESTAGMLARPVSNLDPAGLDISAGTMYPSQSNFSGTSIP